MAKKVLHKIVVDDNDRPIEENGRVLCLATLENDNEGFVEYFDKKTVISIGLWPFSEDQQESTENNENKCQNILNDDNQKIKWSEAATKRLLDAYAENIENVGPQKLFRDKIAMFKHISEDLFNTVSFKCNYKQCKDHYYNTIREHKSTIDHNKKSGNIRNYVPYKSEISNIKALDDSIDPPIKIGVGKKVNATLSTEKTKKTKLKTSRPQKRNFEECYQELEEVKEKNRERYRQEKLRILQECKEAFLASVKSKKESVPHTQCSKDMDLI